jgi:hypothetical protein
MDSRKGFKRWVKRNVQIFTFMDRCLKLLTVLEGLPSERGGALHARNHPGPVDDRAFRGAYSVNGCLSDARPW